MSDVWSLLDILYEGVYEVNAWHKFMHELNSLMNACSCCLIVENLRKSDTSLYLIAGGDDESILKYKTDYLLKDPFGELPLNEVTLLSDYLDVELWKLSEFYQNCVLNSGLEFFIGVDFFISSSVKVKLRAARKSYKDNFSALDASIFFKLINHLKRAFFLYESITENQQIIHFYENVFNEYSVGIIKTNAQLDILSVNEMGEYFLANNNDFKVFSDSIKIINKEVARSINALICKSADQVYSYVAYLNKAPAYLITFVDDNIDYELKAEEFTIYIEKLAIVVENFETIKTVYQLTDREVEISIGITKGFSINDISEQNNISIYTVKAHLRSIFEKMDISKQSQLVYKVMSIQYTGRLIV